MGKEKWGISDVVIAASSVAVGLFQSKERKKRSRKKIETHHGETMSIMDGIKLNSKEGFKGLTTH